MDFRKVFDLLSQNYNRTDKLEILRTGIPVQL